MERWLRRPGRWTQEASGYFLAITVALLVERLVGVDNVPLLVALSIVFLLIRLPWQKIPTFRRWVYGIPVQFGVVGKPPTTQCLRLGRTGTVLTLPGEEGVRFIEIDGTYRLEFIDSRDAFLWEEGKGVPSAPSRRRYEDYGLAHSWSVGDSGPQTFPMHIQVMVRRAQADEVAQSG